MELASGLSVAAPALMLTQVVVRPLAGTLRCAACHDDLLDRRFTCRGCRVVLHRDCRAGLKRCPTYGCTVTVPVRTAPPLVTAEQQQRGVLFHLVWLVPGLLSLLWPVWFWLLGGENPVALVFALSVGPVIGHGCFAVVAHGSNDPGSPHARAAIAEVVGFAMSVPAIGLWFIAMIFKAMG